MPSLSSTAEVFWYLYSIDPPVRPIRLAKIKDEHSKEALLRDRLFLQRFLLRIDRFSSVLCLLCIRVAGMLMGDEDEIRGGLQTISEVYQAICVNPTIWMMEYRDTQEIGVSIRFLHNW